MKKKAAKSKKQKRGPALHLWCKDEDLADFRRAAESEGFNSVSAWVLWNLRRSAKQTLADEQ